MVDLNSSLYCCLKSYSLQYKIIEAHKCVTNLCQVDDVGLPTAAGLVRLYSDGVTDRNYYTATIQSVHQCLDQAESQRRSISIESLGECFIVQWVDSD